MTRSCSGLWNLCQDGYPQRPRNGTGSPDDGNSYISIEQREFHGEGNGPITASQLHYVVITDLQISHEELLNFVQNYKDLAELKIYHARPEDKATMTLCGFENARSAKWFYSGATNYIGPAKLFPSTVTSNYWKQELNIFGLLCFSRKIWFFPNLDFKTMERMLLPCPQGSFLVGRMSSESLAVVVKTENEQSRVPLYYFTIGVNQDGTYTHSYGVKHPSLEHLLEKMIYGRVDTPVRMTLPFLNKCRCVKEVDDLVNVGVKKFWKGIAKEYQKSVGKSSQF